MASSETLPRSIRQGVSIVPPDNNVTTEEVLLAVGEQVTIIIFIKTEQSSGCVLEGRASCLSADREWHVYQGHICAGFPTVSPLQGDHRMRCSAVYMLENEFRRFGQFASGFKTVSLGCKDPKLKHAQSLRW